MATGLPIVASDIAGVCNLLGQQGEYGYVVDNEIEAFARAILLLLDDPARVVALGQRVRVRILDRYNQAVMLDSYLDVIEACR